MRHGMRSLAGPRSFPAALLFFSVLLLVSGAGTARADELAAWYRSDPHAAVYAGVHDQLAQVFTEARRERVPLDLLADKLREGSAKRADPDRMVSALRDQLALLARARLIVSKAGFGGSFLSAGSVPEKTMNEVGIYLRAGLTDHLIADLLSAGSGSRGGRESALAACQAIMDLRAVAPIEDADSLEIGKLLMASGMQPSGYSSLAVVYGLGVSRGLSQDHLVHDVIINTLSTGGGLAIMSQKIRSTPIAEPLAPGPAVKPHPGRSSSGSRVRQQQK